VEFATLLKREDGTVCVIRSGTADGAARDSYTSQLDRTKPVFAQAPAQKIRGLVIPATCWRRVPELSLAVTSKRQVIPGLGRRRYGLPEAHARESVEGSRR